MKLKRESYFDLSAKDDLDAAQNLVTIASH